MLFFFTKNFPNWKQLSIDGPCRVRKLFIEEDVDVISSADDNFLPFHKCTKKVLAPIGVKCVLVALSVNEKNDCSVMITLDMFANIVLPYSSYSLVLLVLI